MQTPSPVPTLEESTEKRVYHDAVSAIRWSPLIRLNKLSAEYECEIWAKCEFMNPGGSVKDRIGKQMILDAEASGRIKPGDTLIEPTSGNTGIGLALTGAVRGYNMIITLPQKMSQEKVAVLEGLGARIIRTPTEAAWDAPESHIGVAKKLQGELSNAHILDQYANPSNPKAHYENTAEEILAQTDGHVDYVVVSAGTGGTITGIAKKIKEKVPHCRVVGADPVGSILAGPGPILPYRVEGIGYDFIPDVLDAGLVDEWVKTEDKESFLLARRLIREEGLLVGGSCGSSLYAALHVAKKAKKGERIVVVLADGVRNYMSKFLDSRWCIDMGYIEPPANEHYGQHTVADLRLDSPHALPPTATLRDALAFLQSHPEVTHLPVISEAKGFEGVVSLDSLTDALLAAPPSAPSPPVTVAFLAEFREIPADLPLAQLHYTLRKNDVAFVTHRASPTAPKALRGVVTKRDLLAFLATATNTSSSSSSSSSSS